MTTDAAAHAVIDLGDVSVPAPPPVPRARPVRPRGLVAAAVVALALLVPAGAAAPARPVVAPPTVLKLDGQLAVDDDAVYAAPQPAGRLRAYDLATGAPRWTSTVTVHGLFFVRRLDDTVLVTVPEEGAQTVALDAATGAVRWRVRGVPTAVDAGIHQVVFLQPTANGLDNPDVDVSGVSAVDLTTGQPRWAYPPKGSRIELVLGVATDGTDQVVAGAIRRSGVETNLLDFATGGTVPRRRWGTTVR